MFIVEYKTISRLGLIYPIRVATIGIHVATTEAEAAARLLRTTQNVEVISVRFERIGQA